MVGKVGLFVRVLLISVFTIVTFELPNHLFWNPIFLTLYTITWLTICTIVNKVVDSWEEGR